MEDIGLGLVEFGSRIFGFQVDDQLTHIPEGQLLNCFVPVSNEIGVSVHSPDPEAITAQTNRFLEEEPALLVHHGPEQHHPRQRVLVGGVNEVKGLVADEVIVAPDRHHYIALRAEAADSQVVVAGSPQGFVVEHIESNAVGEVPEPAQLLLLLQEQVVAPRGAVVKHHYLVVAVVLGVDRLDQPEEVAPGLDIKVLPHNADAALLPNQVQVLVLRVHDILVYLQVRCVVSDYLCSDPREQLLVVRLPEGLLPFLISAEVQILGLVNLPFFLLVKFLEARQELVGQVIQVGPESIIVCNLFGPGVEPRHRDDGVGQSRVDQLGRALRVVQAQLYLVVLFVDELVGQKLVLLLLSQQHEPAHLSAPLIQLPWLLVGVHRRREGIGCKLDLHLAALYLVCVVGINCIDVEAQLPVEVGNPFLKVACHFAIGQLEGQPRVTHLQQPIRGQAHQAGHQAEPRLHGCAQANPGLYDSRNLGHHYLVESPICFEPDQRLLDEAAAIVEPARTSRENIGRFYVGVGHIEDCEFAQLLTRYDSLDFTIHAVFLQELVSTQVDVAHIYDDDYLLQLITVGFEEAGERRLQILELTEAPEDCCHLRVPDGCPAHGPFLESLKQPHEGGHTQYSRQQCPNTVSRIDFFLFGCSVRSIFFFYFDDRRHLRLFESIRRSRCSHQIIIRIQLTNRNLRFDRHSQAEYAGCLNLRADNTNFATVCTKLWSSKYLIINYAMKEPQLTNDNTLPDEQSSFHQLPTEQLSELTPKPKKSPPKKARINKRIKAPIRVLLYLMLLVIGFLGYIASADNNLTHPETKYSQYQDQIPWAQQEAQSSNPTTNSRQRQQQAKTTTESQQTGGEMPQMQELASMQQNLSSAKGPTIMDPNLRRKLASPPLRKGIAYKYESININRNKNTYGFRTVTESRVSLGRPTGNIKEQQSLIVWKVTNKGRQLSAGNCVLLNAIGPLTMAALQSHMKLVAETSNTQIIYITKITDRFAEAKLRAAYSQGQYQLQKIESMVDSDYEFILVHTRQCAKIVYGFANFQIAHSPQSLIRLQASIDSIKSLEVFYTSTASYKSTVVGLPDLSTIRLPQQEDLKILCNYLYIFDAELLNYITPANLAYQVKYTLEQIFIVPLLLLVQNTNYLKTSTNVLHAYSNNKMGHHKFLLSPPPAEQGAVCFISYPSDPFSINEQQLKAYFNALRKMSYRVEVITAVIYLPVNQESSRSILRVINNLVQMKHKSSVYRLRVRLRDEKAVSTLSVYEAVYGYCPDKALIVSSRHNVQFDRRFAQKVVGQVGQKFHYIHIKTRIPYGQIYQLPQYPVKVGKERYFIRRSEYFEKHFKHVQIFKSDLMKTNLFSVLKCSELDFHETEAPFVILMMEQIRMNFYYIPQILASITPRNSTPKQLQQIKNVQKYAEYSALVQNKLRPYPYNALESEAYQRKPPLRMPARIHQIWLGTRPIIPFRLALHQSIKKNNPQFNVTLWRSKDITKQNFPLTYSTVQGIMEAHKYHQTSLFAMAADLLRYEVMYQLGGLYMDFKMEGVKSLYNFLKYDVLCLNFDIGEIRFGDPEALGVGVMGATQNNYYFKMVLTELIYSERIRINLDIPHITGGFVVRKSFTLREILTEVDQGSQLVFPLPYDGGVNECGGKNKRFEPGQQVYEINEFKMGIPCHEYPQAYLISYTPLAKTWLNKAENTH